MISERGSSIRVEVRGGIITFLSMAYILAVNPSIISYATGGLFQQLVAATALAACVSCILMGLYAKFPIALAPGMGVSAFISFVIVDGMGFTYYQALLAVFISGLAFLALTFTGFREKILESMPDIIKVSICAGIGFFIVVIGLFNAGIIEHAGSSALQLGQIAQPGVFLGLLCVVLTLIFWFKNSWMAVIVGLVITVVIGLLGGAFLGWDTVINGNQLVPGVGTAAFSGAVNIPDFGLFGTVFTEITEIPVLMWPAFVACILSLIVVDVFDTAGTLIGLSQEAGLSDEDGNMTDIGKPLTVDAFASLFGSVAGVSTVTSFIESSTGIAVGAKTGLMAVTVGVLFFVAMFFAPVLSVITPACTVGALFLVGLVMVTRMKRICWDDPVNIATAFVTIFLMGLSGSVTDGIALGTLTYLLGMLATQRYGQVSLTMKIIGFVFLAYFALSDLIIPLLSN